MRRRLLYRRLRSADSKAPVSLSKIRGALADLVHNLRLNPTVRLEPKGPKPVGRSPRFRPKRSVVEIVVPQGEPAPARPVVRLRVLGILVMGLFSLMLVRLWYLQVINTSAYTQTVSANQFRPVEIPAPRGLILDRSGFPMVGNIVTQDITLSRVAAQQHPEVVGALAALVGVTPGQIQADLSNSQYSLYKPVPIVSDAPLADVLYLGEHAAEFPGVSIVADTRRSYPLGETGAQLFGYMGQIQKLATGYELGDQVGLSGLEKQYEAYLRGLPGVDHVEVNAQGQVVGSLGKTPPVEGDYLVTNVDAGLQQTLQQALDQEIAQLHTPSKNGAAVAIDPQNGQVLALASSPSYDPTWWTPNGITSSHYQQLLTSGALENSVIDGLYTPGSTFKLNTATAALQSGLISPDYRYNDTGTYTIPGCASGGAGCATYHDNEGEAAGTINVSRALSVSSDVFFYNLGVQFWEQRGRFGQTPIQDVAAQYGLGQRTGIDLPDETNSARVDSPAVVAREHAQYPQAYPNSGWYTGNNLEMAFGQGGTVVTPIEQAVAYATFANGGTRYEPQVAAGLVNSKGQLLKAFAPKVAGHVNISPANYQAMLAGFEGVINEPKGTAYGVFDGFPLSTFPIAGKTGTATTNEQRPDSWFVAWGPVPSPRYLIAVVIQGGGYGASAAAPVVRTGFDYLLAHPESSPRLAAALAPGSPNAPCVAGTQLSVNSSGSTNGSADGGDSSGTTSTTSTTAPCEQIPSLPPSSTTTTTYTTAALRLDPPQASDRAKRWALPAHRLDL